MQASVSTASQVRWSDTFVEDSTGQTVVAAAKAVRDSEHNLLGACAAAEHTL
eukprot:SAG22_NODE_231_length_14551_cov_22.298090_2_plen_52_part_00